MEFLAQSFVPNEGAEAWTKLDFSSEMGQNVSREAYAKLYAAIYQCNDILELFAEKKDVDFIAGSREMMVAEARGLRAFLHFELRGFTALPMRRTTPHRTSSGWRARSPKACG